MAVTEDAAAIAGELTHLRRAIHAEPEIGLQLPLTQQKILAALDGLPLEVTPGSALTSVTAVLRGGGGGGPVGAAPGRHGRAAGRRADRARLRVPDRRHHARLRA